MPSLYLLYHLDGRTVVSQLLKLEIKVVQPRNELYFRRVAVNDNELLGEDSFDDKTAAVMFQSSFAKQFVEANVLLFIKSKRVLMTRRWGLLSGLVGQFSVCIHNIGKKRVATWERPRPRRAGTFRMPKKFSAYEGTARCYLTITKIRGGKIFEKTLQNLRYGFRGKVFPVCNITTVRAQKKAIGADWSGLERTSKSKPLNRLYIAT